MAAQGVKNILALKRGIPTSPPRSAAPSASEIIAAAAATVTTAATIATGADQGISTALCDDTYISQYPPNPAAATTAIAAAGPQQRPVL